jgi:LCP family protein required for cell wall assembly
MAQGPNDKGYSRSNRFDRNGRRISNGGALPPKKKNHTLRNIILALATLLLMAGGVFAAVVYNNIKSSADQTFDAADISKTRDVNQLLKEGKPFSILLLGTDTGELGRDYKGRTDSIMYVTINPTKEQITLVSLPRDAAMAIVGYEETFPQKLNAAYGYGSAATTIQQVENYLNVPVDYYALVNMGGLEKLIDQVGGIEVTSPLTFEYQPDDDKSDVYRFVEGSKEYEYAPDGVNFTSHTKMDGKAALAFSRMRYTDPQGDYGRQARQRLVIEALLKKAANVQSVLNTKFMNSLSTNLKTDLTFNELLTIGSKYLGARKNLVSEHLQGGGVSYGYPAVSYEVVPQSEKQRVTDLIRDSLDLSNKTTGALFGGDVSNVYVDPAFTNVAADTTTALTDAADTIEANR